MRLSLTAPAVVLGLLAPPLAWAQTEAEVSKARAKLYVERLRYPSVWETVSSEELVNPASGLRCTAAVSGFVLNAIRSPQNGAMCEWGRSSDSAWIFVAVLEAGSSSLEDVAESASRAAAPFGAGVRVLPVETSYNGCPAIRFDAWDGDAFKGRLTLVEKGGHFWTFGAKEVEAAAHGAGAGVLDDVYKSVDDFVRPQVTCEAFG